MSIRLPSAERYVLQVDKERRWLPPLAANLRTPIPLPLAKGAASPAYPWSWSIQRWIEGESASKHRVGDHTTFASAVAGFLMQLGKTPS